MNLDWSEQSGRLQDLLARSECVVSREQVDLALDRMARDIETEYAGRVPVLLGVMVGGIMPLAALAQRLRIPLQMDYLHATRYRGDTRGGELHWLVRPRLPLEGRDVIVIDDILDEGITLASVLREIKRQGVSSLRVAVLARKLHGRSVAPVTVDYLGVDVPDRYVFGCGMDYQEFFRQLPAIYALPEGE